MSPRVLGRVFEERYGVPYDAPMLVFYRGMVGALGFRRPGVQRRVLDVRAGYHRWLIEMTNVSALGTDGTITVRIGAQPPTAIEWYLVVRPRAPMRPRLTPLLRCQVESCKNTREGTRRLVLWPDGLWICPKCLHWRVSPWLRRRMVFVYLERLTVNPHFVAQMERRGRALWLPLDERRRRKAAERAVRYQARGLPPPASTAGA